MAPLFPTLAAIIALFIGHPVPVRCGPLPPNVNGQTITVNGREQSITLAPYVCLEWRDVMLPGPFVKPFDMLSGGALLVAVHEAEHYRYADPNEAVTECRALRDYGRALDLALGRSRFAGVDLLRLWLIEGAAMLDRLMPAQYHGAVC